MKKINIPSKFQLGAMTISVNKVKQITGQGTECDGMAFYSECKIELMDNDTFTPEYKEWVFFHELVHHIFNAMAEDELRSNEKIVSRFATFLQQAIKTME